MKVKVYVLNKGTSSQCFGLKNAEENQVLYSAPNNWKTERGARNWALKNGFEIEEIENQNKTEDIVKFEIDSKYEITNNQVKYLFTVISRTAKTVTFKIEEEVIKCRINNSYTARLQAETVFPFGKCSIYPVLSATDKAVMKTNIISFAKFVAKNKYKKFN